MGTVPGRFLYTLLFLLLYCFPFFSCSYVTIMTRRDELDRCMQPEASGSVFVRLILFGEKEIKKVVRFGDLMKHVM